MLAAGAMRGAQRSQGQSGESDLAGSYTEGGNLKRTQSGVRTEMESFGFFA